MCIRDSDAPFIEGEDNSLLDVLTNSDSPVADKLLMDESLLSLIHISEPTRPY